MNIAVNVSVALTNCLKYCAMFIRTALANGEILFQLNTEASIEALSPEQQRQLVESWVRGAITLVEVRDKLKRAGLAGLSTDQEALVELNKKQSEVRNAPENQN